MLPDSAFVQSCRSHPVHGLKTARKTDHFLTVLFHGLSIPTDPGISARQIEGGRTKAKGPHHLRTGQDQITELRSDQGSVFQGMLTADDSIPDEVLWIPVIHDQTEMQIGYLLGGGWQFGHRRQGLPVIQEPSFAGRGRFGGGSGNRTKPRFSNR